MSNLKKDQNEQPILRRSSRSTRGSLKPIVDLTKEEEAEANDDDVQEVLVEKAKPCRRASTKKELPKKEPVKRGPNKKAIPKLERRDTDSSDALKEESALDETGLVENMIVSIGEDESVLDNQDELFYDLSEKELKEINHAFDLNRISEGEELLNADGLRTALRSLGFEPRGDEIKKLLKKFSAKNGKLTRDKFHQIMSFKFSTTPAMKSNCQNDEISRVFNLLDLDKTGLITLENLQSIAKELNEELTQEDLTEMIAEADKDGDFKINKDEFHEIMKKTSLY